MVSQLVAEVLEQSWVEELALALTNKASAEPRSIKVFRVWKSVMQVLGAKPLSPVVCCEVAQKEALGLRAEAERTLRMISSKKSNKVSLKLVLSGGRVCKQVPQPVVPVRVSHESA